MKPGMYDHGGRLVTIHTDSETLGCHVVNEFTGLMTWEPRLNVDEVVSAGCPVRELDERQKRTMLARIRRTAVRRWQKALEEANSVDALDALAERLPCEASDWRSPINPGIREQLLARYLSLRAVATVETRFACTNCGSRRVVPIRYGYPTQDTEAAAIRGEVRLGGCCVSDDMPTWPCRTCDHAW